MRLERGTLEFSVLLNKLQASQLENENEEPSPLLKHESNVQQTEYNNREGEPPLTLVRIESDTKYLLSE